MRKFILISAMFVMAFLLLGCEQTFYDEDEMSMIDTQHESLSRSIKSNWENQLETIINTPPSILKESRISLLGYDCIDIIDDNNKLEKYKLAIKKDSNMIPYYTSLKNIRAITKRKAMALPSKSQRYMFSQTEKYIDSLAKIDMKILRLKWENNGEIMHTLCLVSEEKGIVYDNFITNTIVINEPVISCEVIHDIEQENFIISRLKSRSSESGGGGGGIIGGGGGGGGTTTPLRLYRWRVTHSAAWLFGPDRGEAIITHDGYYRGNNFEYHNFNASHYFMIGNSEARVSAISRNTIAYGYAFSSPGVTINLTFSGSSYRLSFSSTIGSHSGDTGEHTLAMSL